MRRAVLGLFLVLVLASAARALPAHTFVYHVPEGVERPKTVHVAGDFNGWSSTATPLTDANADGVFRARLELPEGVHHYKFVLDGSKWVADPGADPELAAADNYGGKNSGVFVGPDARKAPPPKPDHVNADYLV